MKNATHKEILDELFAANRKLFGGIYSISEPYQDPVDGDVSASLSGRPDPKVVSIYTLMIQPENGIGHFVLRYIVEVGYMKTQPCSVSVDADRLVDFLTNASIRHSFSEGRIYLSYEGTEF